MRDSRRMSKHRVAVLKVVSTQLSVTAAAAGTGSADSSSRACSAATATVGSRPSSHVPADP